jgi:hypothetical protein
MAWLWLADAVVALHALFVPFAAFGGLLALRRPRAAWVHLPCAAWAALIEFAGLICPLTPLENRLRARGGGPVYASGFIEHYVMPVLYPPGLTRELQLALGAAVVALNLGIYALVLRRGRRHTEG